MNEVFVSVDVETDGPIPGQNSMLSIGAAAFLEDRTLLGTFSMNLDTIEGAVADPETTKWWETQPTAWEACRKATRTPHSAMVQFSNWVREMSIVPNQDALRKPVFVGYPAGFDFLFVYWYLIRFAGESPFSHSALDVKSFAMAMLKLDYRDSTKRAMPKRWFDDLPHTHVALADAVEQGALFCNMLAENRGAGGKQ